MRYSQVVTSAKAVVRRTTVSAFAGAAVLALLSTATSAVLFRLTRIPLGRGTATITWTGKSGVTPTINSITGAAGRYSVSAVGHVPRPSVGGGASSTIPSEFPLANVAGTLGGTSFTLHIILTLPSSLTTTKTQSFGLITGTFQNQPVTGTLTANVNSRTFGFKGMIGSLHVSGVISQPVHRGRSATAHATFDVTR
jgi:hypothetical protein